MAEKPRQCWKRDMINVIGMATVAGKKPEEKDIGFAKQFGKQRPENYLRKIMT